MGKTGRADLESVGLVGAIADQVNAELALGVLHRRIGFAFGHVEAFGEEFEVVDEVFHARLHAFA